MAIVYYCDKCGKEISSKSNTGYLQWSETIWKYEICKKCFDDFVKEFKYHY